MEDNLSVYSTGQYVGATERIVHSFEGDLLKIHFSIKSTAKYHNSRLILLLLSWFQAAPPTNVSYVSLLAPYLATNRSISSLIC